MGRYDRTDSRALVAPGPGPLSRVLAERRTSGVLVEGTPRVLVHTKPSDYALTKIVQVVGGGVGGGYGHCIGNAVLMVSGPVKVRRIVPRTVIVPRCLALRSTSTAQ